jgi:integrase
MKKIDYAGLYTLRSDGRYQGYYRDADGKRHAVCDKDPERLHKRIAKFEEPTTYTFADIADAWKNWIWPRLRAGTQVCYNPAYKRAVELFGSRDANGIEPYEVKNHLISLAQADYSAKTIKTQLIIYRAIYRFAIVDPEMGKQIRANPADQITLPQGLKRPEKREAPEDDVIKTVRRSYEDYFGVFPLFLLATGFRRGEALATRWRDINWTDGTISCSRQISYEDGSAKITPPKTSAGIRTVPLLPDLKEALVLNDDAHLDDFIFHGEDPGKPLQQSTFRRRWSRYCKEHSLDITPHVLRHAYATMLFEAGVDVYTAQKLLGHADIETTMAVYTHLREKQKNESIDKLMAHVMANLMA